MPIIRAQNLEKTFLTDAEQVRALKGVDFEINKGDFSLINGPSGSGKTTLLNLLSGIDTPTAGELYLDDISIIQLNDSQRTVLRRDKIGLVFQSFELLPVLTVYENVEYPLILQGVKKGERDNRVKGVLSNVGLSELGGRKPSQLSGGQKQRVAIARALVTRPQVVFADEPTGNLDSKTGKMIIEQMLKLNEENRVAFVIITHDLSLNQYAKKLFVINDGILAQAEVN
jgi:putative ABC transport system ATP-binding protein